MQLYVRSFKAWLTRVSELETWLAFDEAFLSVCAKSQGASVAERRSARRERPQGRPFSFFRSRTIAFSVSLWEFPTPPILATAPIDQQDGRQGIVRSTSCPSRAAI